MLYPNITYIIRQTVFDIFNNVVGNWSEEIYENILCDALLEKSLKFERQKEHEVMYKDHRVGLFYTDLIVENKIILELKSVPEIFPLHQAQTISYLKVTGLKLAMLINFGGAKVYIRAFPNKLTTGIVFKQGQVNDVLKNSFKKQLVIDFDINKLNLPDEDKILIQPFLMISKEILEILGPGYFHQVYRRAFWDELKYNNINFEWIKQLELKYQGKVYDKKELKFYKINDLLISIVAVNNLNELVLNRFSRYVKHYKCDKGLIINFNNIMVDFRYLK